MAFNKLLQKKTEEALFCVVPISQKGNDIL